jgi:hypothetical protein
MPHRITVLAAILIALGSGLLAIAPSPRALADSPNGYCSTVKIIGVRGSGEAYHDGYGGFGPEMSGLMADIWNPLAESGVDVSATAVPYPAYDFLGALLSGAYLGDAFKNLFDSMSAGVDDLFQLVDSEEHRRRRAVGRSRLQPVVACRRTRTRIRAMVHGDAGHGGSAETRVPGRVAGPASPDGWTGVAGPRFSAGWNVYTGVFDHP